MQRSGVYILLLLAIYGISIVVGHIDRSFLPRSAQAANESTHHTKLNRAKRVAIYNGQGVVKFVGSVAHPVKQVDKDQSFWFFYNLQNQYIPTTIPIYWWSFWNTTAFVSTARELRRGMEATLHRDDTRSWFYDAIETGMEQLEGSERGATCLLRSICEISQLPFDGNNIFSEILNAILIPTMDNVSEKYLDARDAGRNGADCLKTYRDCSPRVWDWLTHITKVTF